LIIPTKETICAKTMIKHCVTNNIHILLIGPTGTAKSVSATDAINNFFSNEKSGNLVLFFSG